MRYALVSQEGAIDRISANVSPTVQTKHGWMWLPVEDTPEPDRSIELETLASSYVVGDGKVTLQWNISRRDSAAQSQAVKDEARRRILDRYPDWKQANMTARGVELTLARIGREWTGEEEADAIALQAAWDWIKSVRSASDVIEVMSPIPADFRDAKHWPE